MCALGNAIEEYWHGKHPFIKRYSFMGIDILGEEVAEGRITLKVELI
jgi:hypothetical protein